MIIKRAMSDLRAADRMIHAPSAELALVYLRDAANEKPGLILLDLNLPGMSGTEFLQAVKADPSLVEIPVIVLTSSQERQDIVHSFDLRAVGYVVKPSTYAEALEALKIIDGYWSLNALPAGRR
jgi:CheY-like chemotaxis protein